ncbi:uncharacterized protein LOC126401090 [Xyrichtys novacula]|uniref:Uncharacterized protein LOC126401090 n=1 Tax=Xyrichtys novacula TaxID=13765 RepID=A0AAV1GL33_XYRNO|nr:uncharacterized protein LOC126401090 [Xyrichtys novacula]
MVVPVAPGEPFFEQVDSLNKLDALINWKTINILYLKIYCHYSCGKIFAHWTEECKQLIAGKHTPVFRLKRKAEQQDIEETMTQTASDVRRMCMAESMQFCVYQTSDNTGERLLYPEVKLIKWVQCKTCRGWLHLDCAGMEMEPFDCGIKDAVDSGGIHAVFSKTQIKTLHDDLLSGKLRSNRMFLWRNPATSLRLKQHLKIKTLSWSEQRMYELLRFIEEATNIAKKIKTGNIHLLDFVLDVMLPELLIKALKEHGISRFRAELMMACGNVF